jgi:hypothetical protein
MNIFQPTSLQSIPQYAEVPPNIEAKQIISYFSVTLSHQSNPLLLKDESKLLIFLRLLAGHLLLHFYDPDHFTQKRAWIPCNFSINIPEMSFRFKEE